MRKAGCFGRHKARVGPRKRTFRCLHSEALPAREMLAATVGLAFGVLAIDADAAGSWVEVRELNSGGDSLAGLEVLQVATRSGDAASEHLFPRAAVSRLVFRGSRSADQFLNRTRVPAEAEGFAGDDLLVGGPGDDVLLGGAGSDLVVGGLGNDVTSGAAGNDRLYGDLMGGHYEGSGREAAAAARRGGQDWLRGGLGNDLLAGGDGNDRLAGHEGSDRLFGNHGHDRLFAHGGDDLLFGQVGNDRLYAGDGDDALFGGYGDDGLFGGTAGRDVLSGGNAADSASPGTTADSAGRDRYLTPAGTSFELRDLRDEDAQVHFHDRPARLVCGEMFTAGSWSDAEIEAIDVALAALQRRLQGQTGLLKRADGRPLNLARNGAGEGIAACNSGDEITLVDNAFQYERDWLWQVVFHEVGHHWEEESTTWSSFLNLSGWVPRWTSPPADAPPSGDKSVSGDGEWLYDTARQGNFAEEYGKTNPYEDFATVFAACFMDYTGRPYLDGGTAGDISAKLEHVARLLDDLAAA